MPLVKASEIYNRARQGGYAIGGFCAENLEMVQAILQAAEESKSPVVIVLWEADIEAVGPGYLEAIIKYGAQHTCVPVAIMLDHGTSLKHCMRSILDGHSAVMIDASHESFEENVRLTREVCHFAHQVEVMVEGELGTIRRSFENTGLYSQETVLTEPGEVAAYVEQSGVDSVAISIGTESGIPTKKQYLDFDRLRAIAAQTEAYLVLHGGSGTAPEDVRLAVENGIIAFRFASEMRIAFLDAFIKSRQALPVDYPDTRLILGPAREAARTLILERMEQLGCVGKAW